MVDTVRTQAALQALLADNTAGDISAQDVRDFLVSVYGFKMIETVVAASSTALTFSSIPAFYRSLRVEVSGRSTASATISAVNMTFNGDTGANYAYQYIEGDNGSVAGGGGSGANAAAALVVPAATSVANAPGTGSIEIPHYLNTTFHKGFLSKSVYVDGAAYTGFELRTWGGFWTSTAAITSITLTPTTGWVDGSRATLFGLGTP